jgi:hypothetical protein
MFVNIFVYASAINIVRIQMSGSLAVQGRLCPCVARGRGSEQARERGECGGLSGRCGGQDSAVRDRDLVVRGRDLPWMAKTWPQLHQNKALEVCFILVLAMFFRGNGEPG